MFFPLKLFFQLLFPHGDQDFHCVVDFVRAGISSELDFSLSSKQEIAKPLFTKGKKEFDLFMYAMLSCNTP